MSTKKNDNTKSRGLLKKKPLKKKGLFKNLENFEKWTNTQSRRPQKREENLFDILEQKLEDPENFSAMQKEDVFVEQDGWSDEKKPKEKSLSKLTNSTKIFCNIAEFLKMIENCFPKDSYDT